MKTSLSLVRLCAILGAVIYANTHALAERQIPGPLKDWQDWATWDAEHRGCPTPFNDAAKHVCFWPGELSLTADQKSATWELGVTVFSKTWVPLPGGGEVWPLDVRVDGAAAAVVEHGDRPCVQLAPGRHKIAGAFRWDGEMPQLVRVPREVGVLSLFLDGKKVELPNWDADGNLWLKRTRVEATAKDAISAQVWRVIEDGIPLWLRTEIELSVSGKSREEELGNVVPEGWSVAAVDAPVPVAVDEQGRMKAQVRAGKWTIRVDAFRTADAREIKFAEGARPVTATELVGFRAAPEFRSAEIAGLQAVDVTQTTFPEKWRNLPVYQWPTNTKFQLVEKMRGMGLQKPEGLRISRVFWLDEDGKGLTFRDQISGAMQQIWRLDIAEGQELGAAKIGGQAQLITTNPENKAHGVEIRARNLSMTAIGRSNNVKEIAATGWRAPADNANVTINLPPGWRLFALFGADWVRGDWLTAWTLLDLFLLLIFSLAVFRLWGWKAGIVAFLAFGLAYHEPESPRYTWLALLLPLALLRVVPEGGARKWVLALRCIAIAALLLCLVPFVAKQIQGAIYPQLEQQGLRYGSRSLFGRGHGDTTHAYQAPAPVTANAPAESETAVIERKLNSIIIPKIDFRDTSLREAVEFLKNQSRQLDPELAGVNIALKLDDAGVPGLPNPGDTPITLNLTNIPLMEALRYISDLANMKVRIDASGASLVPVWVNTEMMLTKEYQMPPEVPRTGSDAKAFLEDKGAQFPPGASVQYLHGSGRFAVRNTQSNLDVIDAMFSAVGSEEPPQTRSYASYALAGKASRLQFETNLFYESKAKIQTGPAEPEWKWNSVSCGWNGPVSADEKIHPIFISLTMHRVLTVVRVALLLLLGSILLRSRGKAPIIKGAGAATTAAAVVLFALLAPAQSFAQSFPVPEGQQKLAGGRASAASENHRTPAQHAPHPGGARRAAAIIRHSAERHLDDSSHALPGCDFFRRVPVVFASLDHRLISVTPPASMQSAGWRVARAPQPSDTDGLQYAMRVALLLLLGSILLRARGKSPIIKGAGVATAAAVLLLTLLMPSQSIAQLPDKETLDTLRQRLLETSDAYPNAAEIPSVDLKLTDGAISMTAEVHAAVKVAVPLPGRLPSWSPLSVKVDGTAESVLRRDDGYLWAVIPEGVHRVTVEGLLPAATEWAWTFLLKPRRVSIDAPGWTVTGVRPNGIPENQVFFARQRKATGGEAAYDRKDFNAIVAVDRHIEVGLLWQAGKAVSLRVPLLAGEKVLTSGVVVEGGFVEVRLGAGETEFAWESELPVGQKIALTAEKTDRWVERWHLVTSPVWNATLAGLAPVFETSEQNLVPVWHPWPGESVTLSFSKPEAVSGDTITVRRVQHTISLGARQSTSQLALNVEASLGDDFILGLAADAEVTSLKQDDRAIPVRRDGAKLVVPVHPGSQTLNVEWRTNEPLRTFAGAGRVKLPVEAANITTVMNTPESRWVLWAAGPLRGPAVRFWTVLAVSALAAWVLGGLAMSPLRRFEWVLLAIGLTQVHFAAALVVVGWFFLLAWRGKNAGEVKPWKFDLLQIFLTGLTVAAMIVLIAAVKEGLLGDPEMFIRGNGSTSTSLQWFQPRGGHELPVPRVVSVSIWFYRLLMLAWALWLAAALIRWLKWAWTQFSEGGCWRRSPKKAKTPPPIPK